MYDKMFPVSLRMFFRKKKFVFNFQELNLNKKYLFKDVLKILNLRPIGRRASSMVIGTPCFSKTLQKLIAGAIT